MSAPSTPSKAEDAHGFDSVMHGFDTVCIHGGHQLDPKRAHLTPIYASSTYSFDSAAHGEAIFAGKQEGYAYGRFSNPTIEEANDKIALMEAFGLKNEKGEPLKLKALLHASGMGAISTVLFGNLKAGDCLLSHHSLYGGTQVLLDKVVSNFGITIVNIDFHDIDAVRARIDSDPTVKMMYLETPANPTLRCVDLAVLSKLGKEKGLIVVADNTFATPYLQQPFRYDIDYVIHSTTKYLNGHGTAIGGILVGRDFERMKFMKTVKNSVGACANAFDAFLLCNGIRTFPLRMEKHCSNAKAVAEMLAAHPAVEIVHYLGLPSHPDHAICLKQMRNPGAMIAFELRGGMEAGIKFINALKLLTHAVSLGNCDTLLSHPASTTSSGIPKAKRIEMGITDGLVRMSVGLETVEDIIQDLQQALEQ